MKVEFTLPTKAFSLNAYRYGNSPHKTKEAREYEDTVMELLECHSDILTEFNKKFYKEVYGTVEVSLVFMYPSDVFFNAKKIVSARTFDLSNVEKPLLDLILNRYIKIDDRFVTKLTSSKVPGEAYEVHVSLELKSNS